MSQGRYSSEEEALVGLARQLADAFEEAQTEEDRQYAADAIDDFLSDHDHYAPTEALIALLDLPLTKQTWPLVDSVESTLIERGTEVVEELLDASRGHVYDLDGPVPQRALETLHGLSETKLIRGLLRILAGRADDELKQAAVDQLVALGEAGGRAARGGAVRRRGAAVGRGRPRRHPAPRARRPGRRGAGRSRCCVSWGRGPQGRDVRRGAGTACLRRRGKAQPVDQRGHRPA